MVRRWHETAGSFKSNTALAAGETIKEMNASFQAAIFQAASGNVMSRSWMSKSYRETGQVRPDSLREGEKPSPKLDLKKSLKVSLLHQGKLVQ